MLLNTLVSRTVLLSVVAAGIVSLARAENITAVPADAFRQFVSVQTHLNWPRTIWDKGDIWRPALNELGVRLTRSAFTESTTEKDHLDHLYLGYGIRASATINVVKSDCTFDRAKALAHLHYIRDVIG